MVCHVLRYAPFFRKAKELLDEKRIGEVVNFQLTENVVYWHFAHSFVRGNFRNEAVSSPWDFGQILPRSGPACLSHRQRVQKRSPPPLAI